MMENGMWPLNGANKKSPQATPADDNDNIRKTHLSYTVKETIYIDDGALPYYEYFEFTTSESESSPYLDRGTILCQSIKVAILWAVLTIKIYKLWTTIKLL